MNSNFWSGKSVLITGHTGFKGLWLSLLLKRLGANVFGISLPLPNSTFYRAICTEFLSEEYFCDLRYHNCSNFLSKIRPDIVFHLVAQPLVKEGYSHPVDTYMHNVIGTVNLLDSCRLLDSLKAVVVITTDKVYDPLLSSPPYVETALLGGLDPYSSSKACAELVTRSYFHSFLQQSGISVSTARAGNVLGGGDTANDRLIPDAMRSWLSGNPITIRYPFAVRPWQHVLDPLFGYLLLAHKIYTNPSPVFESYNFGPSLASCISVNDLLNKLIAHFPLISPEKFIFHSSEDHPYESSNLTLDSTLAINSLNYRPRFDIDATLYYTARWYRGFNDGQDALALCDNDITAFLDA